MSHARILARLALVLVFVSGGRSAPAAAPPSDLRLRDYVHTSWTHADGMPLGMINKLLQTSDGYLWVSTRDALLRFDGMRFVRTTTPCTEPIQAHAPALDGGFWIVCGTQLIKRTIEGRFVVVSQTLPELRQPTLLEDRRGRLWLLGATIRVIQRDGTGLRTVHAFVNPPGNLMFAAALDVDGTVWASDGFTLFHLQEDGIERVVTLDTARCLTPARDGGVFVLSGPSLWHLRNGRPPSVVARFPHLKVTVPLRDCMQQAHDGSVWMAPGRAVAVVRGSEVETFGNKEGFEGDVTDLFIDREGSIWAGARSGLHRFRPPTVKFDSNAADYGLPLFLFVDSKGNRWTGTSEGVYQTRVDDVAHPRLLLKTWCSAIGEDERGNIWLSIDAKEIGYVADGTFHPVPDAAGKPVTNVYAFRQDHHGNLWALAERIGVYRVTPGAPRLVIASPRAANRFLVSERSGIWFGRLDDGVEQHLDGRTAIFRQPQPAPVDGSPRTLFEDGDSIWIGSFSGLLRVRRGALTLWTGEHGLPGDGSVKEIAADRFGHLWMMSGGGLLRVARAQLDGTPDGQPRPLSFAHIGAFDGVVAHPGNLRASPAVAADANGRLYFTTVDSVAVVDPAAVMESSMIPPIALEAVIVDNEPVDRTAGGSRFVSPSRLRFEYTSLSLRSPEHARFRYRLEGYDANWIEAGTERQVTYGTLHPGAYRFRVIGAGSEGVWNETGASFAFTIAPVFWRTWWFQLVGIVFVAAIAGGLYRLRVRQLTRQFNRSLDARVAERTRIARELHDTLLQSVQGLMLRLQSVRDMLPAQPVKATEALDGALDRADQAIVEGRDAIQHLRTSTVASSDLAQTLTRLAEELTTGARDQHAPRFSMTIEGSPRDLHPIVRDDVHTIAREALGNAFRHARAAQVEVDITYRPREVRLRVRDDGRGIDPAHLDAGRARHWGLISMRERADQMGARLDVWSEAGAGTEVELRIPGSVAYGTPEKGGGLFRPRRQQ